MKQTITEPIHIVTYANQDTLEIIYEFESGLSIEIQQNKATVTSLIPGTFGGNVCAIADSMIDCQQFDLTFVEAREAIVEPIASEESKQSTTYASQMAKHFMLITIGILSLLAIVAIGWKREKNVQPWEPIQSESIGNVPSAPDLSLFTNGFDNR